MLKYDHMDHSMITRETGEFSLVNGMNRSVYDIASFLPEYLEKIGQHVLPKHEFKDYLFKTIETPYVDGYTKLFPDMKFIHLVRDPVAVCSSQKRSIMCNKMHPASYLGGDWLDCMMNKRWLPHARIIEKYKNSSNHILVRYEDLVKRPIREVSRIVDQFSLTMPQSPDLQTEFCNQDMNSMTYNPSKKGIKATKKVVPNFQKVNKYDELLTSGEVNLIRYVASGHLLRLGYEAGQSVDYTTLLRQTICLDKWDVKNCRSVRSLLKLPAALIRRRKMLFP